jgi:hypothetical protein
MHHHVPADDEPEALDDLLCDCSILRAECELHAIALDPPAVPAVRPAAPRALAISESTVHLLDGYPEYGD